RGSTAPRHSVMEGLMDLSFGTNLEAHADGLPVRCARNARPSGSWVEPGGAGVRDPCDSRTEAWRRACKLPRTVGEPTARRRATTAGASSIIGSPPGCPESWMGLLERLPQATAHRLPDTIRAPASETTPASVVCVALNPSRKSASENVASTSDG